MAAESKIKALEQPVKVTIQTTAGKQLSKNAVTNKDVKIIISGQNVASKDVTLNSKKINWATIFKQEGVYKGTIKDYAGRIINVSFTIDKKVPVAPSVKSLKSNKLTGKAEKNATISVVVGSKEIRKGKANAKGEFAVTTKQQVVGTKVAVYVIDGAENKSKAKIVPQLVKKPAITSLQGLVNKQNALSSK